MVDTLGPRIVGAAGYLAAKVTGHKLFVQWAPSVVRLSAACLLRYLLLTRLSCLDQGTKNSLVVLAVELRGMLPSRRGQHPVT